MTKFVKKFLNDFEVVNKYYNYLVEQTKKKEFVGITNEWLIDNFYLLVEHKTNVIQNKKDINKRSKIFNNIYRLLRNIAVTYNYNIDFSILINELNKYQKESGVNLSYKELESVRDVLLFIYSDKLKYLCIEEQNNLIDKEKITHIIKSLEGKEVELSNFVKSDFNFNDNRYYLFELNNQLSSLGAKSNKIFKELNELLDSRGLSLKEIINDEYQRKLDNNLLISNIFNDLKEFFDFNLEDLLKKVSKTEKLLLSDEIYSNMTIESKALYRRKLLKNAKKKKLDEVTYLERVMENADRDEYHIGFQLIKKSNPVFKVILYISTIILVTVGLSYYLSQFFIAWRWLGFLILLIPVSQLFVQILNYILVSTVRPEVLPKLDYSKGLPKESTTMVVIPTIVGNKQKIKDMFDVLETFYLINKSNNLYFTLLGDIKAANQEVMEFDEELSNYGVEYADKLNKKYGKEIFFYIYRKRLWNEKENQFLGYERKRGALIQFNKILLGKMDSMSEKKYFNVNTLHNKKLGVKYVITLDTDTD